MIRIAVQNPFVFLNVSYASSGIHKYAIEFIKNYVSVIYLRPENKRIWRNRFLYEIKKGMKRQGIDISKFKFVYTERALNECADVLIDFNGVPYKDEMHRPPSQFDGLSMLHLRDFYDSPTETYRILHDRKIDIVLLYSECVSRTDFFKHFYKEYIDKAIRVPFGFEKRFQNKKMFEERKPKAVLLGALYKLKGDLAETENYAEYATYFNSEWSHPFRKEISDLARSNMDIIDSYIPQYPEVNNTGYDAVEMMNNYMFFINDYSLCEYATSRTYEGIACGTIMIAQKHPCFLELGFIDNENCILIDKNGEEFVQELRNRIHKLLNNKEMLLKLHTNSLELAKHYTHKQISDELFNQVQKFYEQKIIKC